MGIANYMKVLSPSNVNSFLEYRSMWFLQKIMGKKWAASPEMERGKAVEHGITLVLMGNPLEEGIAAAQEQFKTNGAPLTDVEGFAEFAAPIPDLVKCGVDLLKPYGKLVAAQRKVNRSDLDATPLPWVGYIDFLFEGDVVVDLKVTGRTPSSLSGAHARQGAFYHKSLNASRTDFLYLVPLKTKIGHAILPLENPDMHFEHLMEGARAMDRALSLGTPEELKHLFFPCPDEWWLKEPMAMEAAKQVWRI